jgi:hypothetical protein
MAIYNTEILASNTTLVSGSAVERAVTTIIVCNTGVVNRTLTIFALGKDGTGTQTTAGTTSMIVNALIVPAGDTVSFDQEKVVLGATDTLVAIASDTGLTATVSVLVV